MLAERSPSRSGVGFYGFDCLDSSGNYTTSGPLDPPVSANTWRQYPHTGAADAGRVFLDEDPDGADEWHSGVGGGFWLSFLNRMQTLSVAIVNGDDLTGVYLRAGFMF